MTRPRLVLVVALWALAGAAALGALALRRGGPPTAAEAWGDLGQGSYALETTDGAPFTAASLEGGASAVFFGFTHCPDVCPTTLGDIGVWQDALAAAGEPPLRVFFVTVDPERDTAAVLGDYVGWVDGVTGVTGPREQTDAAIRAFRIYAEKVPTEGGGYTMDHSASVLLFDAEGRFSGTVGYGEDPERALAAIRVAQGAG